MTVKLGKQLEIHKININISYQTQNKKCNQKKKKNTKQEIVCNQTHPKIPPN